MEAAIAADNETTRRKGHLARADSMVSNDFGMDVGVLCRQLDPHFMCAMLYSVQPESL